MIDVFSRDDEGATELHRASSKEYRSQRKSDFGLGEDLDEVLALGPDLDAQDSAGHTPLHYAIGDEDFAKVRQLVEAGANLELRNRDGDTPLLYAVNRAGHRKEDIHKCLLEAGADPYAKDLRGFSPFSMAQSRSFPAFAHLWDVPVPDRPTPTKGDLGKERWGKRATTAQFQDEYEAYREQYGKLPSNAQWVLIYALDTTRQEAQHNGNCNRPRTGVDVFSDNMGIVRNFLLRDPEFTEHQKQQISHDIDSVLNVEYPAINNEPYDRLQDRIVEYIRRHPEPIPHNKK